MLIWKQSMAIQSTNYTLDFFSDFYGIFLLKLIC